MALNLNQIFSEESFLYVAILFLKHHRLAKKGDFWVAYYRIIFELFDRLCQIIENPSVLLILQLSSFQSKIIL